MKKLIKKISVLKFLVVCFRVFGNRHGIFKRTFLLNGFFAEYFEFKKLKKNKSFKINFEDLYPRIYDKTGTMPVDPVYFYQDTWCAGKIFENKPEHHYDIGSSAEFIGIVSKFVPVTMVDIRPIPVSIPSLSFKEGSILKLPFADDSLLSVSSICVIEHIGLGRYGDPIDQFGSEKAASELVRVLVSGGNLYISVPIDSESKVYFNAHRVFSRSYVLELFGNLSLVEEKYVYGNNLKDSYDKSLGFGTGLFHFKKQP